MARFTIKDRQTVRQLGKCLAQAVHDPATRAAFKQDAKGVMAGAGVDPAALGTREIVVHEDSMTVLNVMIPHEIDESRLTDPDYLEELGRSILGSCRMPLPRLDSGKPAVRQDEPAGPLRTPILARRPRKRTSDAARALRIRA